MLMGAQAGDVVHVEAIGPTAQKDAQDIAELIAAPGSGAAAREPRLASAPAPALAAKPLVAVALDAPGIRRVFSGVSAAPGLAVGVSRRLVHEQLDIPENGAGIELEMAALTDAIARTRSAIESAIAHFSEPGPVEHGSHGNQQTEILTAHLSFLDDSNLRSTSDEMITAGRSAAFAWQIAVETQITALRQLGNEVLAERAADLLDIERRVLLVLCGRNETALELPDNAILFADDLLPSQFAGLEVLERRADLRGDGGLGEPADLAAAGRSHLRIRIGLRQGREPRLRGCPLGLQPGGHLVELRARDLSAWRGNKDRGQPASGRLHRHPLAGLVEGAHLGIGRHGWQSSGHQS